jgi:hypothetical protein
MLDPAEFSDAEFLEWAGAYRRRWALLPGERREAWLEHLIARMKATEDSDERDECWRLAYVIATADAPDAPETAALR